MRFLWRVLLFLIAIVALSTSAQPGLNPVASLVALGIFFYLWRTRRSQRSGEAPTEVETEELPQLYDDADDVRNRYDDQDVVAPNRKIIEEAMESQQDITMEYYTGGTGEWNTRSVTPLELEGNDYLVAFCRLRNEERTFKLARMRKVSLTERSGRGRRAYKRWMEDTA